MGSTHLVLSSTEMGAIRRLVPAHSLTPLVNELSGASFSRKWINDPTRGVRARKWSITKTENRSHSCLTRIEFREL